MRARRALLAVVAAALATAGGIGTAAEEKKKGSSFGFKGLVEVRQLDVLFYPGEPALVRAHLATGMTVEEEFKDADAIDEVLRISSTFAQPRCKLAVTLEASKIVAFHLSTGGSGGR